MEYVNNIASGVYIFIRIISLALTVMIFHLGFTRQPEVDWNTKNTRLLALSIVSLVQVTLNHLVMVLYGLIIDLPNVVIPWKSS